MHETTVERIIDRININKAKLRKLDKEFYNACAPGSPGGTSYLDADTIHGGNKEFTIQDWYEAKRKLITLIGLDETILESLEYDCGLEDKEYLNLLDSNAKKVAYCRVVKGYTQTKTAELLGLSERQIRRIEKNI